MSTEWTKWGNNQKVLDLVEEQLRPIGRLHYHSTIVGPWTLNYTFPGGYLEMTNYMSGASFGGMDDANLERAVVTVHHPEYIMHIGTNGAFVCPATQWAYEPLELKAASAEDVADALDWAFGEIAKDLANRSLAKVAMLLRDKECGFRDLKRIADVAKEILG